MKYTTTAIIVSTLFSLSSCHSHRAVESTAGLHTHTETADSVAATRRTTASAKEASETVEINFFAPDSTGRQAVRSISRHRRLAAEERTDTVAGSHRREHRDYRADHIDAPAAYALPTFACRIACGCNNTNLDNLYN